MDRETPLSFGRLLKEHHLAQGLSQEYLAEKAGLSREAISLLERGGRRAPRRETIGLLAKTLNLSGDDRVRLLAAAPRQRANHIVHRDNSRSLSLPPRLTSFIGREREIAEILGLLQASHLVTLSGHGGIGKTILALAVAAEVAIQFADVALLVDLGALSDGELVPFALAAVLGVREQPGDPILTTLARILGTTERLLVLDNCEHLLPNCALLAESLLRACSRLWILATSREPLRIGAEVIWRVPALTLPDDAAWPFVRVRCGQSTRRGLNGTSLPFVCAVAIRPYVVLPRSSDPSDHSVAVRLPRRTFSFFGLFRPLRCPSLSPWPVASFGLFRVFRALSRASCSKLRHPVTPTW